ncbi:nucleotidyltransferase, partial [Escherichia coli]
DIMIGIKSDYCTYYENNEDIKILIDSNTARLNNYTHDNTTYVNSRKIINLFVSELSKIEQYSSSEINRRQEAATLKLKSYDWNFDIVPCFITVPDIYDRTFYLIPDGNGHWKKTDPRIDKNRTTDINVKHDGNMLNVIRIVKYWQKRKTMPTMSSYLLETILLNYYDNKSYCSPYVDIELEGVFRHISDVIYNTVNDHKNIQGDINNLPWDDRVKISNKALSDAEKVNLARDLEEKYDYQKSINVWREIFGDAFPQYG